MSVEFELSLTNKALKLIKLDKDIIKAVINKDDKLLELIIEFVVFKKGIKLSLTDIPFSVTKTHDKKAREIIQKISLGEPLPLQADDIARRFEKSYESSTGEKLNLNALSGDELDEMVSDLFYSWFSPQAYIEGLYEIGSLTVGVTVPDLLVTYVQEARSSYAFQNYNAVYSLCRTIIEASIRDICLRKKLIKEKENNVYFFKSYSVGELISKVSKGDMKDRIHKIFYEKTSPLIHGRKTITSKEAKETFKDTLKMVHDLYSIHGF